MAEKKTTKEERYIEAVGRRKTAVARVRITKSSKQSVVVNEQPVEMHFPTKELQHTTLSPFANTGAPETFTISAKVKGGGIAAQAEAVRHGIARALVTFDQELRKPLKAAGFLKRDPRIKERKKFGLKKARKAAQWSKR